MFQTRIQEATRLTREGRLAEASALLQRALAGADLAPTAPSQPAGQGRIIDVDPETGEVQPPPARPGTPPMPDRLRGFLDRMKGGAAPAAEPLPEGAQFLACSFTGPTGTRGYRLYIPARPAPGPRPLVIMLHGCTQSPEDFAAGTRMNSLAEAQGCLIAYPGQTQAANAQKCWNWFNPADQRRDQGEPALLAGITRQIMRDHAVDARRVYIAGLSAGGAAAAIMGIGYPELYAAVGVHSGLACGAARDVPSAFAAMHQGGPVGRVGLHQPGRRLVPSIVFHADKDGTVHPRNADQVIAQYGGGDLHGTTRRGQVPGGHAYSQTTLADAAGRPVLEQWLVHGGGHAWSGGSPAGTYTDPRGPDASAEMLRFFLEHPLDTQPG